ncbi:outer membrane protein assembly factor BamB family protein [Streptomyces abikoensis]|uniref:PQQ-binding-like beta-propeller repeat protein n=1 Tax=Streptomyces abikoensis TaxID=97398 RepID=A0ABW7SZC2_9ACTN
MTQPPPPMPPHQPARTPQIWDTDINQRSSAPPGFGPPPPAFGGSDTGGGGSGSSGGSDSSGRGRRKALLIVLALALIASPGAGGWLLWGKTGRGKKPGAQAKPSAPARVDTRLDWLIRNPDKDRDTEANGTPRKPVTWFAHGNVIRTRARDITAYDVRQGTERWNIPLPGVLCAAARKPDGDTVAVLYSKTSKTGSGDCNGLMAVDLGSGHKKWDQSLPLNNPLNTDYGNTQVLMFRGKVKVMGTSESATFAAGDGKVLDHPKLRFSDNCMENRASTDGKALLSVLGCSAGDGRAFVQRMDPETGKEEWTWKVPDGLEVRGVPSVNPAVVAVSRRDRSDEITDLISISPEGRTRAIISLTGNGNAFDAIVRKDTVYLASQGQETAAHTQENRIIAIDLANGEKRWESKAGGNRVSTPLGFIDDRPLIYQIAQSGDGGKLVTLDPRDGAPTVVKRMPAESAEEERNVAYMGQVYFEGDRLFMFGEPNNRNEHLALSFS